MEKDLNIDNQNGATGDFKPQSTHTMYDLYLNNNTIAYVCV